MQKDYFSHKAKEYDGLKSRTQNVDNIGQTILKEQRFTKNMQIMDFGSGTGLLLSQIAPIVGKVTAVDVSPSMNEVLQSKLNEIAGKIEIRELDLTKQSLNEQFDAIISSMTIHHVDDVPALFEKFYGLLNENATIAIADLDKEDGSFHTEDTGVFHLGFDRDEFLKIAENAGFRDLKIQTTSVIEKPTGKYPVFLLTGRK